MSIFDFVEKKAKEKGIRITRLEATEGMSKGSIGKWGRCSDCKHYTPGVTEEQRREWSRTAWGRAADGVCHLFFPRGYISRKPPHPARAVGGCFQFDPKEGNQLEIQEEK